MSERSPAKDGKGGFGYSPLRQGLLEKQKENREDAPQGWEGEPVECPVRGCDEEGLFEEDNSMDKHLLNQHVPQEWPTGFGTESDTGW